MGLEVFVALVANGVGVGAALNATYGVIGALAIRLAGGVLLGRVGVLLAGKPKQQELKRDLSFPTSRPSYRFPYGRDRVPGTPLPYPVVGEYAYACWLVSSRPSDGGFTVLFDGREVDLTGDPYDFTLGGGATATEFPFEDHVTVWIGRGDQVSPPQVFLDEAGYVDGGDELLWKASDAGKGCTVVWARMRAGDNSRRAERWPSAVPGLELEGRFSKVWNPRDVTQSLDTPASWLWSENASLCALDAFTQNPFRPYEERNVAVSMWEDYADVADESVSLKSGGSESRFVCSGVVVFDGSELEALVQPLLACGGARLTRSGGQLGVVPAAPRTSVVTISESLEGLQYSSLLDDASLVTDLRVNYSPLARGGEPAELSPWSIPGALAADGGQPSVKTLDMSMVPSATQAQRLRNIYGKQARLQRSVTLTAPPSALAAVSGSVVALALPTPYGTYANRLYEVRSIGAAVNIMPEKGIHMRAPVVLTEYSAAVFDWDPATDEEDVVHVAYDSQTDAVQPPTSITVTSGNGVDINTGGSIVPRFLFSFTPSPSASASDYEWQWRLGVDDFQLGGVVDADAVNAEGKLVFYLNAAAIFQGHDVRVRAVSATGSSDWLELTGAIYSISLSGVTAAAEPARIRFLGLSSAGLAFGGVRAYRGAVGSVFADASPLGLSKTVNPDESFNVFFGDEDSVNLLTNGTFDDASDWAVVSGWSIGGGVATHATGAQDFMRQAISEIPVGSFVRLTFDLSGRTAGTVGMRVSGDTNEQVTTGINGTYSNVIPLPSNVDEISFFGGSTFDGSVDNAFAVVSSPAVIAYGEADFWLVPVAVSGVEGAPVGPFTLQIP